MIEKLTTRKKDDKLCHDKISTNAKCIFISIGLALAYWFTPPRNKWVLIGILYFTYLVIAHYDHWYDCRHRQFGPTYLRHFYEIFKPYDSVQREKYRNLCPDVAKKILYVDIALLIAIFIALPKFLAWNP
jgi:hypothetical protein